MVHDFQPRDHCALWAIVRDDNGLALSSRNNGYLSDEGAVCPGAVPAPWRMLREKFAERGFTRLIWTVRVDQLHSRCVLTWNWSARDFR